MKRQIVRIEDISNINLLREGWRNATKGDKYRVVVYEPLPGQGNPKVSSVEKIE